MLEKHAFESMQAVRLTSGGVEAEHTHNVESTVPMSQPPMPVLKLSRRVEREPRGAAIEGDLGMCDGSVR